MAGGTDVIQLVAKLSADATNFVKEIGRATKANKEMVHDMANKTKDIASSVAVGAGAIGAAIAGGLGVSAYKAQEVRNSLGEVASLGVKDLDSLRDAAVDFSNKWAGTTAPEFISSAYDIKSAVSSLSDEAVAKFAEYSAITAKATKATTQDMSKAFTTAYGIFKPLEKDMTDMQWAEKFSGAMSAAVQQFKTDGNQMADAIKSIGAIATTSNVPLKEQLAILGTLQQTMPGAEAGTQYKAFMMTAAAAGEKLKLSFTDANGQLKSTPEILDEIKKKFPDLSSAAAQMKLKEAFGSEEAVKYVLQLMPKIDQLRGGIDAMGAAWEQGSAKAVEMAEAMNTDKMVLFKQQMGNLIAMVGEFVLTALGPLLAKVSEWVLKAQEWIQENKGLTQGIVIVTAVVGALAGAIAAIATVVAGIAGVVAVFSGAAMAAAAPVIGIIAIVIGVIVALAGAAYLIYDNWGAIEEFFVQCWEVIKMAFSAAWDFIKMIFDAYVAYLKFVFVDAPMAIGTQLAEWLSSLGQMIMAGMQWIGEQFYAAWEGIKAIFLAGWESLKAGWQMVWEPVQAYIDLLKKGFDIVWQWVTQGFNNFTANMKAGWEAFKQGPQAFIDWMKQSFQNAFENIVALFGQLWEKVKGLPGAVWEGMKDAVGLGGGSQPPGMAAGGIVRSPTIARIGEAGPEAVIPLNSGAIPIKLADSGPSGSPGGVGGAGAMPPINIYQQPGEDGMQLAKRVATALMNKKGWVS